MTVAQAAGTHHVPFAFPAKHELYNIALTTAGRSLGPPDAGASDHTGPTRCPRTHMTIVARYAINAGTMDGYDLNNIPVSATKHCTHWSVLLLLPYH